MVFFSNMVYMSNICIYKIIRRVGVGSIRVPFSVGFHYLCYTNIYAKSFMFFRESEYFLSQGIIILPINSFLFTQISSFRPYKCQVQHHIRQHKNIITYETASKPCQWNVRYLTPPVSLSQVLPVIQYIHSLFHINYELVKAWYKHKYIFRPDQLHMPLNQTPTHVYTECLINIAISTLMFLFPYKQLHKFCN